MDLAGYRPRLNEVAALFGKSSRWISDLRAKGEMPEDGATLAEFLAAWGSLSAASAGGGGSGGVGSLLGKLKGLFGGGGAANSGIGSQIGGSFAPDQLAVPTLDLSSLLSHFAAGSDYTPGGVAWVGENGPEMVSLPQGSKVTNAGDTRRLMQPANDAGPREVHNHFTGNVMTPEFWGVIQSGDDHAAMRGTSGGRALSKQDSVKAGRRKLGTR